jgi:hypothetical protein
MAERVPGGLRRIWTWFRRILATDPGPSNLAESVADRLFDNLTPQQRTILRMRFGVDSDTSATLDEIAAQFAKPRRRIREIESQALIRLYRWKHRKARSPAVQGRLVRRIAAAHDDILDALCDAPPIRSVLVGWHDQLVDGRRSAGEIAEPPDPVIPDDPEDEEQSPELVLAAMLRKALWAHARGHKAARQRDDRQAGREDDRARALEAMRATRFNAQSILALAEALLGHARRIQVENDEMIPRLLDPVMDPDARVAADIPSDPVSPWAGELPDILERDPALADVITAESGMPVGELWERAARIDEALAKARHNLRLLVDSGMPMVAETVVAQGLRGEAFVDAIEAGRAALLQLADRFCFTGEGNFTEQAEQAVRVALEAPDQSA